MMDIIDEKLLRQFVDWLTDRYYDVDGGWDSTKGGKTNDDIVQSRYDFGNSYTLCAALVSPLREAGHTVAMAGGEGEDMLKYAKRADYGLDWLVVDDRYVLDPWSYSNDGTKIVYDLHNPEDQALAAKMFPPREAWNAVNLGAVSSGSKVNMDIIASSDQAMFKNGALWREYTLPHQAVDDLLNGGLTER